MRTADFKKYLVQAALPALSAGLVLLVVRWISWPLWEGAPIWLRMSAIGLIGLLLTVGLTGAVIARRGSKMRNLALWSGVTGALFAVPVLDADWAAWEDYRFWSNGDIVLTVQEAGSRQGVEARQDRIVIDRAFDGAYYLDGRVGAANIRFLVDTGASGVALSTSDARQAGIRVDRLNFNIPMSLASGTAMGAGVRVPVLEIHGSRFTNINAVVVPDADVSLLGMDVLNRFRAVEMRDGQLTLYR